LTDRYVIFEAQPVGYTDETWPALNANTHILDVSGEDITADQQFIYPETSMGRLRRNRITGPKKFAGPIDTPLYPRDATSLLYYAMGGIATVVDTPTMGVHTHTLTKAKTIPAFRMAVGRDVNEHRYTGCLVNGVTIDYAPDEVLTGSFNIIARRELGTPSGNALDTATSVPDFNSADRAFGGVEVVPEFDDVVQTGVESASISWENNVAEDAFALGSPYLPAKINAGFVPSGSMDLRFDAITNYEAFLDEDSIKFELNATYGATTAQRDLGIECPQISMDTNRLPTDNLERYVQTIDFTPERDANDNAIIITVINAVTNANMIV